MSKLIVLEGLDNCGKDTQIGRLARWITRYGKGLKVVTIPSITDTNLGIVLARNKKHYTNPNQMIAMFIADYYNKIKTIEDNSDHSTIFIANRWYYSTLAYSKDDSLYLHIKYLCGNTDIKPDVVFYLDITVEESLKRQSNTSKGKDQYTNKETLKYAQKVYDMLLTDQTNKFVRVDGTASIKQITDGIIDYLKDINIIQ